MIHLREASLTDVYLIHKLAHEIWWPAYGEILSAEQISFMLGDMYTESSLVAQMEKGAVFLLAERENIPVGFVSYTFGEDGLIIHKLYILPAEQGLGTGRNVIESVYEIARATNCSHLQLNVNRNNPALGFYQKQGFEVYAEVDIPYHDYVLNDYVLRKQIIVD